MIGIGQLASMLVHVCTTGVAKASWPHTHIKDQKGNTYIDESLMKQSIGCSQRFVVAFLYFCNHVLIYAGAAWFRLPDSYPAELVQGPLQYPFMDLLLRAGNHDVTSSSSVAGHSGMFKQ